MQDGSTVETEKEKRKREKKEKKRKRAEEEVVDATGKDDGTSASNSKLSYSSTQGIYSQDREEEEG